jgi:uncharacterized protein (DUF433 family)
MSPCLMVRANTDGGKWCRGSGLERHQLRLDQCPPASLRITTDPTIYGGKPIIRGMRFAVEHLIGYLDAGMSEEELLEQFPFLEPEDIAAAKLFVGRQT